MTLITTTEDLDAFCRSLAGVDYITVDTEFLREKTYWPQLCLVQVGGPNGAVAIDPLAEGIDLAPLFRVMVDPAILKVFHAARQDVEIFWHLSGQIPHPLFDTQVAAMVCGFGESVGYETLVTKLAGARIDKSSRFTDWSHRPLTERQLTYALSDVIHLRPAYEKLKRRLVRSGRAHWLEEEMAVLTDPATYQTDPDSSWLRLKVRTNKPRFMAVLKELAAWREREAQRRDLPRSRVLRDEALLEIAAHAPTSVDDLARTRGMGRGFAEGRQGAEVLSCVQKGLDLPESELPRVEPREEPPPGLQPIVELLRVLLKMKCEENNVASKLIASAADLEAIAADDEAQVPAMQGWRRELFGEDALALKHGRIGLAVLDRRVRIVPAGNGEGS
ncbi:ribonuclease D [Azospirillum brasilense]|uniref:Ribonuclease D n=1 Tax=Azospirillum brasilense TaxID=192 RepID=A0A0P0FBP4_AZOBR|nr:MULTISPECIES: ribonuclease D [Azospirillum]ALJ37012.1 ribonuclease D [Azospirillum brasilense]MDW7551704.1 ribonuclease D [Azospirillum brasilense]MDW7591139.1 ribonuclease D [Azospirillum brasilense]MDW7626309.1 ribonuclease D [Azospirillum brasilense]MDX5951343.1 ribonuclease D [Azospirillum brasilense]